MESMLDEDFQAIKSCLDTIRERSRPESRKNVCFKSAMDIISIYPVDISLMTERDYIFPMLYKNQDRIFPYLGLRKDILDHPDLTASLTNSVLDILDQLDDPEMSSKECTDRKLDEILELENRIDILMKLDMDFKMNLYREYSHIFLRLTEILKNTYTYEVNNYKQKNIE